MRDTLGFMSFATWAVWLFQSHNAYLLAGAIVFTLLALLAQALTVKWGRRL